MSDREDACRPPRISDLLGDLAACQLPDRLPLEWLIGHFGQRSFGAVMFVLGIVGALPAVSILVGLLLLPFALQMLLGKTSLRLPAWITERPLSSPANIRNALRAASAVVRRIEIVVRPRFLAAFSFHRAVGLVVLLLALTLLIPIPFTNVVPSLTVALLALAYLESDGVLLLVSVGIAIATLLFAGAAVLHITRLF